MAHQRRSVEVQMSQLQSGEADGSVRIARFNYLDESIPHSLFRNGNVSLTRNPDGTDAGMVGYVEAAREMEVPGVGLQRCLRRCLRIAFHGQEEGRGRCKHRYKNGSSGTDFSSFALSVFLTDYRDYVPSAHPV